MVLPVGFVQSSVVPLRRLILSARSHYPIVQGRLTGVPFTTIRQIAHLFATTHNRYELEIIPLYLIPAIMTSHRLRFVVGDDLGHGNLDPYILLFKCFGRFGPYLSGTFPIRGSTYSVSEISHLR